MKKAVWMVLAAVAVTVTACAGGQGGDAGQAGEPASTSTAGEADTIAVVADTAGTKQNFTKAQMKEGQRLFKANCGKCHVGGQTYGTYNVKEVNLSMQALAGATPPRNNIAALVNYMEEPTSYDGTEKLYATGRHPKYVTEGKAAPDTQVNIRTKDELNLIAAFILKEATYNTVWGRGKDVR
ncbi:MAG: c-type cytochrome [Gloeobacterales cyanobacterium]